LDGCSDSKVSSDLFLVIVLEEGLKAKLFLARVSLDEILMGLALGWKEAERFSVACLSAVL
jgi:hypothetical protein